FVCRHSQSPIAKVAGRGPKIVGRPSFPGWMMGGLLGLLFVRHFGTVCCAAALALAGVLAFAAVIAGLAAAFALARVLAFTRVLFLHLLGGLLVLRLVLRAKRRPQPRK